MKRNILIIDDHLESAISLQNLLKLACPENNLPSIHTCPIEALEHIMANKPDLIFSDINMPGLSGFELLSKLPRFEIPVVFVTTHEEYTIRALATASIDFLIKPVKLDRLLLSIERIQHFNVNSFAKQSEVLQENLGELAKPVPNISKIIVNSQNLVDVIETQNICYCEANGSYTAIFLKCGRSIISSKPLRNIESLLCPFQFFRTHRSFLVNVSMISQVNKAMHQIILANQSAIPISSEQLPKLLDFLRSSSV